MTFEMISANVYLMTLFVRMILDKQFMQVVRLVRTMCETSIVDAKSFVDDMRDGRDVRNNLRPGFDPWRLSDMNNDPESLFLSYQQITEPKFWGCMEAFHMLIREHYTSDAIQFWMALSGDDLEDARTLVQLHLNIIRPLYDECEQLRKDNEALRVENVERLVRKRLGR